MKITKSKSTLKLKLQVVISEGNCPISETLIYMFLRSSGSSLGRLTNSTCMWMLFCCMFIKLFKSQMSRSCFTDTSPQHQKLLEDVESWIEPGAQADTGDACLLNPDYYTNATQKNTLTIAGVSDVPMDIVGGVRIARHDLCSTHEEADIVITEHAISCSLSGKCVHVVCYGTDVFVLLVHFYHIKCRGRNYRYRCHCNSTQRT